MNVTVSAPCIAAGKLIGCRGLAVDRVMVVENSSTPPALPAIVSCRLVEYTDVANIEFCRTHYYRLSLLSKP